MTTIEPSSFPPRSHTHSQFPQAHSSTIETQRPKSAHAAHPSILPATHPRPLRPKLVSRATEHPSNRPQQPSRPASHLRYKSATSIPTLSTISHWLPPSNSSMATAGGVTQSGAGAAEKLLRQAMMQR